MISLKNTGDSECTAPSSRSSYGYGLRLYLNDDQCNALGIKTALAAGTQVTISAKAVVISATESVEDDGDDKGNDISLDLQITDMDLTHGAVLKDAATVLYGTGE